MNGEARQPGPKNHGTLLMEALLQTHMDEREAYLAAEGLTVRSPTPEQDLRLVHP